MNRKERRAQKKLQPKKHIADLINTGCQYLAEGKDPKLAFPYLKEALDREPNNINALTNLGECFRRIGELEAAKKLLLRALDADPNFFYARLNIGAVLGELGEHEEAIKHLLKAAELNSNYMLTYSNLGELYRRTGDYTKSLEYNQKALNLDAKNESNILNYGVALNNFGIACKEQRKYKESLEYFYKSWGIINKPEIEVNIGTGHLMLGEFDLGWKHFERRFDLPVLAHLNKERFKGTRWNGEDLNGKTILLYAEQGLGDAFQFIRYASILKQMGATVVVWMFTVLVNILKSSPGIDAISDVIENLPEYDYHISVMSLPYVLKTNKDTIPSNVPYIFADADKIEFWRKKLESYNGLKIGITWAGNPGLVDDLQRSVELTRMKPILEVSGVNFFSLQKNTDKNKAADQLSTLPENIRPIDFMDEVNDFSDTAGLVANLDLVISVDTSIVHLTGGMNKPVWMLSRFNGCWRWMTDLDQSPWYPSMKIYRLERPYEWDPILNNVATDLFKLVNSSSKHQ